MARKTKKRTTQMRVDSSETGCVLRCPLCDHRAYSQSPRGAWRSLYRHLSQHHDTEHAARLAETARKRQYT